MIAAVAGATSAETALRTRLLTSFFNFFPALRPRLLREFIRHSAAVNDAEVLEAQFSQFPIWFDAWKIPAAERRSIFLAAHDLFLSQKLSELAYTALRGAVTAGGSDVNSAESRQTARSCVVLALSLPDKYVLDDLAALPAVAALKNDSESATLHRLLEIVVSGTVTDFEKFDGSALWAAHAGNLSQEVLLAKMRLLSLASAAENRATLPYAEAAKAMGLPPDDKEELEKWLIRAMSRQLLTGKLDQENGVIKISNAVTRTFGPAQWAKVESEIEIWLSAVRKVQELVAEAEKTKN